MDFRFTQDQQDLIDAAKAFFDGENTAERMRALAAGEDIADLWQQFGELGLLGVMVPESADGLEQPLVVMAGIAEAAGYAGLSEPYVEIAGITVPHANQDELSGPIRRAEGSVLRPYVDASLTENGEGVRSIDPLRDLAKSEGGNGENIESINFHGAVLSSCSIDRTFAAHGRYVRGICQGSASVRQADRRISGDQTSSGQQCTRKLNLPGPWCIWQRLKAGVPFIPPRSQP